MIRFLGTFQVFLNVVLLGFALVAIGFFAGPLLGLKAKTMTRYAYYILIPAFVFNVISQSSVPLSKTLTMVGYSVVTHIMVAIGAVIVGTILDKITRSHCRFCIDYYFWQCWELWAVSFGFSLW